MQCICYLKRDCGRLLINRSPYCSQFRSLCLFFRQLIPLGGNLFTTSLSIAISAKNIAVLPRKFSYRKTGETSNLRRLHPMYYRRDVTFPSSPLRLSNQDQKRNKQGIRGLKEISLEEVQGYSCNVQCWGSPHVRSNNAPALSQVCISPLLSKNT